MIPDSLLTIERHTGKDGAVVELRGELDLTNTRFFEESLSGTTASTVILDLGRLDYVDSAGMRAIDEAHRRFREAGRSLLIVAPQDSRAAWTFRVAGFADGLLLESVELALRGPRADKP